MITGLEKEAASISWMLVIAMGDTVKRWDKYPTNVREVLIKRLNSALALYEVICSGKVSDYLFIASARTRIDILAADTES